ncbi:ribosome maturation factor RimM [bacterium]|nr:ribosome maturation factor RimM [bacterium]
MTAELSKTTFDSTPCCIGKVGKPHGFRGDFFVLEATENLATDKLQTVRIGEKLYSVRQAEYLHKGLRLHLEGIESEEALARLRGEKLWAERTVLPQTETDEYLASELVGSQVIDERGTALGTFVSVENVGMGSPDRWWVEGPQGMFALPAVWPIIQDVNLSARTIRVRNDSGFEHYV